MSLVAGTVSVTSIDGNGNPLYTGSGLALKFFDGGTTLSGTSGGRSGAGRGRPILDQLDALDTASSSQAQQPDPGAVAAFYRAAPATNGPLVAGYAQTNSWPPGLLGARPGVVNRLPPFQILAAQCVVDAGAIIGYLTANAVVSPAPSLTAPGGGGAVTGSGSLT